MIREYLENKHTTFGRSVTVSADLESASSNPELTNMKLFQAYVSNYLKGRPDLHQELMTLLVRQLDPGPTGLPLEICASTRTVDWQEYEAIQGEIADHLLAALPQFDLRVFHEPARRFPSSDQPAVGNPTAGDVLATQPAPQRPGNRAPAC